MATSGSGSKAFTSWDTLEFSWSRSSYSVANNTSTISWTLKLIAGSSGRISSTASKAYTIVVNGTKYTGTTTIGIANNATKTLASGTTTIAHNSDGTKTFSWSVSQAIGITFSGKSIGTQTFSGTGTLNTIPRKSSLSVANGTLGTAQTLTVTRQATSFTHTIVAKCGSASTTVCTKSSSTSISFTPPLAWASQNTTGTSVSVTYTITTFNGNTSVGSTSYTKTCSIPSSVKPSCTIAVTDAMGYANTYGGYVKGMSKFKIVVTPTTSYGAAIKSYKVTANGSTYSKASVTTGIITKSGTLTITATVTDARGRTSSTASVTATVLDYTPPTINNLSVKRCNEDGSENDQGAYIYISIDAKASILNMKNDASYSLGYKKSSDDEYTMIVNAGEMSANTLNYYVNASVIGAADTGSSYDVVATVQDNLSTVTKTTSASTAFTIMHFKATGRGMGLGKIAEEEDVLDVGFALRAAGGILHPVLEVDTDLNDVRTPNTYVGANVSDYNYLNCPITSGTFTLEVLGAGEEGQVKQRLTNCRKTDARAYERFYYQGTWGNWVCVSDYAGTLLWEGGYYMTAAHSITFSEQVSKQKNGIVLVFSEYVNGTSSNTAIHTRFIPKKVISLLSAHGHTIQLTSHDLAYFATKYLYISDTGITGHANNNATGTGTCGIKYTNNRFVLRYVIGV